MVRSLTSEVFIAIRLSARRHRPGGPGVAGTPGDVVSYRAGGGAPWSSEHSGATHSGSILQFFRKHTRELIKNSQKYSKLIPIIGEFVVGDKKPYEYLVKSISEFVDQDELIELMKKNNFEKCEYNNLSGGIVSLHSAWKI